MFNFKKNKGFNPADAVKVACRVKNVDIVVIKGDITEFPCEAVVCEANTHLNMEEGAAANLKRKGGAFVQEALSKLGPAKVGDALLAPAGQLPAQFIIHAVTVGLSPRIDEAIIRKATYQSLLCAQKNTISAVAFPVLGHDSGDVPYEVSSKLMAQEIFRYIKAVTEPSLRSIYIVCYSDDVFDVFKQNVCGYLEHLVNQGPFLTVDAIIDYQDGVVLVERSNPPFGWALPGGFVDYGESVETAVAREVKEETDLKFTYFKQFKVYSEKERDPRFHTVSVVFTGQAEGAIKAGSDAAQAKVFKPDELPARLAFDHRKIINEYILLKNADK